MKKYILVLFWLILEQYSRYLYELIKVDCCHTKALLLETYRIFTRNRRIYLSMSIVYGYPNKYCDDFKDTGLPYTHQTTFLWSASRPKCLIKYKNDLFKSCRDLYRRGFNNSVFPESGQAINDKNKRDNSSVIEFDNINT